MRHRSSVAVVESDRGELHLVLSPARSMDTHVVRCVPHSIVRSRPRPAKRRRPSRGWPYVWCAAFTRAHTVPHRTCYSPTQRVTSSHAVSSHPDQGTETRAPHLVPRFSPTDRNSPKIHLPSLHRFCLHHHNHVHRTACAPPPASWSTAPCLVWICSKTSKVRWAVCAIGA